MPTAQSLENEMKAMILMSKRGIASHLAAISKCLIEKKAELLGSVMKCSSLGSRKTF